ncbi:hypothetical protein CSC2_46890 [Clostridium zeae]|uniref:Uncharacterized protein n=1 Tax=Clostridium zeae TaxID=2759022 RepID=A0ABQ1EH63_9CLOT|nr:hypothetical protein [Clostridium zeae]GFZ34163.1 hypothetical protein CSC2_46890 [Clostridium zeae]
MEDRYIYLVFSKTGTWLSKIIYLITKNKYAHSSVSIDDTFTKMYSFGRTSPRNPFSGGFVQENLYEGVYSIFKDSECIIYRIKVSDEQYDQIISEINKFIISKSELKYNFIGLFGVWFNRPIKRKNHYFCTQFVSQVLSNSNIYKFDKKSELIKSDDIIKIPNKELIYKGYVYKYSRKHNVIEELLEA